MSEWIGLIGALAGTAIGGYVTFRVAKSQQVHENKQEYQRKFVTVCESIHELMSSVAGHAGQMSMMVIGDLGHDVRFDASQIKEKSQLDRLKMLVGFYTPELKEDVEKMIVKYQMVVHAVGEVILQKQRTEGWKTETVKEAAFASAELTNLVKDAQEKLAKLVNAHTKYQD